MIKSMVDGFRRAHYSFPTNYLFGNAPLPEVPRVIRREESAMPRRVGLDQLLKKSSHSLVAQIRRA